MSNVAGLVQFTSQVNDRASERALKIAERTTVRIRAAEMSAFALSEDVRVMRGGGK